MALKTGLPNATIPLLNGQLGSVQPTKDATCGLIVTGVAVVNKIGLADPKQIFSLADAVALGIDAAYDVTNNTDAWKQIKEFYDQAGTGKELWIMLMSSTVTMANTCDIANNFAKKLLDTALGKIRFWGICRMPDATYVSTYADGIDADVNAAVLKAHALCEAYNLQIKPCRAIVGARDFQGTPATLRNFRANTNNRVQVALLSTSDKYPGTTTYKNASVGFLLGSYAKLPVQRKPSRLKNGDAGILAAYMTNGQTIFNYESAWDSIHDKGYVIFRKVPTKNGFYVSSDPTCVSKADDYSSFCRGRVIDKATMIAYDTFVNEIEDDLDVDENGYLDPAVVKDYQRKITNAIELQMLPDEISGVTCEIDHKQNLLANDTVQIKKLGILPKVYATYIDVPLGFTNPLNS
jgi:hypothetical protein